VRVGNIIEVSGTAAVEGESSIVGPNDPYSQTRFIIAKIEKALNAAGATVRDVVRTRIITTDISRWEEIGRAREGFQRHPASHHNGRGQGADRSRHAGRNRSYRHRRGWGVIGISLSFRAD